MRSWIEIYFLSWQISIKLRRCSWWRWWLHQNIRQLHAFMQSHHLQQPLQDQPTTFNQQDVFSKKRPPGLQIIYPGARCDLLVHTEFTRGLGVVLNVISKMCPLHPGGTESVGELIGGLEVGWKVFNIGWLKVGYMGVSKKYGYPKMDGL